MSRDSVGDDWIGTREACEGTESESGVSSGFLDEFRKKAKDFLGRLEELKGGPVSEIAGVAFAANSETADNLAAQPDRLPEPAQLHLTALAGLEGEGMFNEKSDRADIEYSEQRNLADVHVQLRLGLDALRSPAIPTRLWRDVGDDGEPLDFERRRKSRARSVGLRTRARSRASGRDREAPDSTPWTV